MKYRSEIIDNSEALLKVENEWDYLYNRCLGKNIFLSFKWISSLCEYNKENKPFIIFIKDDQNNILGIAPLGIICRYRFHLKTRILSFLAEGPSDYQDFLILRDNQNIINEVIRIIKVYRKKWDVIELKEFPYDSINYQFLLANSILRFESHNCSVCTRIEFAENNSDFEFGISKKTKEDIYYQLRRLKRTGNIDMRSVTNVSQISSFINSFAELHKKRWNRTITKSSFNSVSFYNFFNSIVVKMFNQGLAKCSYLDYNGKIVACHIGFRSDNTFYCWMLCYDPDFSEFSIGKLFLYLVLKSEADNNLKSIDFLRGSEDYKNHWGVNVYHNIQLTSIKYNLKGLLTILNLVYNNNRKFILFRVYRKFLKWVK
jgi:CelD/BcsL family acetyltransferase involved in cellulose biosynthesis